MKVTINDEPLPSVLRLACLLSVLCNGLKPKAFKSIKAAIDNQYGYQKLALTWPVLQKLGMFKKHEGGRAPWLTLKKQLRLLVDSMPDHEMGAEPHPLGNPGGGSCHGASS